MDGDRSLARRRAATSRPPASDRGRRPEPGTAIVGDGGAALLTARPVGQGEILFLADAVAARERVPRDRRQRRVRARARGRREPAGRVPRRRARLRREPRASPRSPIGGRSRCSLVAARRARVRVVARPPLRTARSRTPATLPPARAEYVQALSVSLERTHDPGRRAARRRSSGRATAIAARAGLGAERRRRRDRGPRRGRSGAPTTRSPRCSRRSDRRRERAGVRASGRPRRRDAREGCMNQLKERVTSEVRRSRSGRRTSSSSCSRPLRRRPRPARRRAGRREDAGRECDRARARLDSAACSSRPTCCPRTSSAR